MWVTLYPKNDLLIAKFRCGFRECLKSTNIIAILLFDDIANVDMVLDKHSLVIVLYFLLISITNKSLLMHASKSSSQWTIWV